MRLLRPIIARRTFALGFVAAITLTAVGASPPPSRPRAPAVAENVSERPTPAPADRGGIAKALAVEPESVVRTVQTVGLFALISLAPAAVLMVTSFVRINIVLILLRQALGSPQVPGNQVIAALALLLTALVMRPVVDVVYTRGIKPYSEGRATPAEAWQAVSRPVKAFMVRQIEQTHHQDYLWQLQSYAVPRAPGQAEPVYSDEFPFRVVAAAYLLSELTTALVMGFYIYLPFLVIDLVVSAVLAAMGLFMLPPALVSLPLKLILFVLADGWLLVATMLLRSFTET
jgi:flagellar biosynthetic protein FliP